MGCPIPLRHLPACVKLQAPVRAEPANVSMNAKSPAKSRPARVHALALGVCMLVSGATADDGNLQQQLRTEQQGSAFRLMLEQVEESARRRAAEGRAAGAADRGEPPRAADPGDAHQSLRLPTEAVADPAGLAPEPESARRLRARQARERDRRRILDEQQRRSALVAGTRTRGLDAAGAYAERRRQMDRFKSQNRRLSVQRKLRR